MKMSKHAAKTGTTSFTSS